MLARELKYYPENEFEIKESREKRIKRSKAIQKKNNSMLKLFCMSVPLIISAICISILFRYVDITAVRTEITQLESQIVDLEKTKINLIGEMEGLKSSYKISQIAKSQLGMDYPTENQIVYVSVNEDLNEKTQKDDSKKPLDSLISMIGNLF